jgi:tetratricopeptide (TPR) repeat protein
MHAARPNQGPGPPWVAAVAVTIVAAFAVSGLLRLNPFCLLEPDSPDYLFTARSLATFDGYREIDHPDNRLHAFRPPGLPLLLAPLSAVRAYDPVGAKVLVLATAVGFLLLATVFARRVSGPVGALAVLLLLASSPFTLLHATEVVSEAPYLVAAFAVPWLVTSGEDPSVRRRVLVGVLLAAAPLLRSVGFALLGALALWSLLDRRRRVWWLPVAAALGVNLLWLWRNGRTGTVTYFAGMRHDLDELGIAGYLGQVLDQGGYYASRLGEVLLPGVFPGPPLYRRFLLDDAPTLNGLGGAAAAVVLALVLLAGFGLWRRAKEDGALIALHIGIFVALLLVYPPRHERLAWPLVPWIWIYAAVGVRSLAARRVVRVAAAALVAAVVLWQAASSFVVVRTNLAWWRHGEAFYADAPPMYYANWQAAGRWLADNAPPWARVLTRHSDVGFTSRRLQDSLRFEETGPLGLQRAIDTVGARYVVMPATLYDLLAPPHLVLESPAQRLREVWRGGDVLILEVEPNREGTVVLRDPRLEGAIERCRATLQRLPHRVDLARRLAELLQQAGRHDEGLEVLDAFTQRYGERARIEKTRGGIQLDLGRFEDARTAFARALELPDRRSVELSVERGLRRAEQGLAQRDEPPGTAPEQRIRNANAFLGNGLFSSAAREVARASSIAPHDPRVIGLEALLFERTGEIARAEDRWRRLGGSRAMAEVQRIDLLRRLLEGDVSLPESVYLRAAENRLQAGLRGNALALLERARERFPESAGVRRELGLLYLVNSRPESAEPLLAAALDASPQDGAVAEALRTARKLLTPRDY